jgi:hypothetical protein
MKRFARYGLVLAAAVALAAGTSLMAAEPKHSVDEVMKKLHKPKNDNVFSRVIAGKGTVDERKMIVEYYESMIAAKPEKGDAKKWQDICNKILTAAKAAEGGDAKALSNLKTTYNCKACHDQFRD